MSCWVLLWAGWLVSWLDGCWVALCVGCWVVQLVGWLNVGFYLCWLVGWLVIWLFFVLHGCMVVGLL